MDNSSDAIVREVYGIIREFADAAKQAALNSDNGILQQSSIESLRKLLPSGHPRRSILRAKPVTINRVAAMEFDISGKGNIGLQTCVLLPVHFAAIRALEIVPGVKLFMHDETRSETPLYRLNFSIPSRKALELTGYQQAVGRLLFHVSSDAVLSELRGMDHHHIMPSSYVLTKQSNLDAPTQDRALKAIRKLVDAQSGGSLPFTGDQMEAVLTDLLTVSDDWHWKMPGRMPEDERRRVRN